MNEFRGLHDFQIAPQLVAQEILDRLDVVIDLLLDRFDRFAIGLREARDHVIEPCPGDRRERRHFRNVRFRRQGFQPGELDQNAVTDQPKLTENLGKGGEFVVIAPVQRR